MIGIAVVRYLELKGVDYVKPFRFFARIWHFFFAKGYGLFPGQKRQKTLTCSDGSADQTTKRTGNTKTGNGQC